MKNTEEDKIVDDLNREFAGRNSLVALVVCFGLSGWMMAATAFSLLTAG